MEAQDLVPDSTPLRAPLYPNDADPHGLEREAYATPLETGEGSRVREAASYRQAAENMVASGSAADREAKQGYLGLARVTEHHADQSFAHGDAEFGQALLDAEYDLIDDVFSFATVKDSVSRGSSFLAGVLDGSLGLPSQPLEGYERSWNLGNALGHVLHIGGDVAAVAGALSIDFGAGGLALASGGFLAPAAAGLAASQAGVVAAAVTDAGGQWQKARQAWQKRTEDQGSAARPTRTREEAILQAKKSTPVEGKRGRWSGDRGESNWYPSEERVLEVTKGQPVRFKDSFPDFKPWARETLELEGMDGVGDFTRADGWLANKLGLPSARAARLWRSEKGFSWHHVEDCITLLLVPFALNNRVDHLGGKSLMTKGGCL